MCVIESGTAKTKIALDEDPSDEASADRGEDEGVIHHRVRRKQLLPQPTAMNIQTAGNRPLDIAKLKNVLLGCTTTA